MHIPRVVAAVLAVRQLGTLLPADYCTPECPSCKAGIVNFDSTTECVSNSSFLTNCGACQTCVQTYAIENPNTPDAALLEADIAKIINACADSPASTQVEALQSQASRISLLASMLVTTTASPTTSISHAITPAPTGTWTGTHSWSTSDWDNESWTSILATASWAPYYYSRVSRESASQASAASAASAYAAANMTASVTSAPMTTSPISSASAGSNQSLNRSWIIGPVIGSILGVSTVFIVVFFTRRKQKKDARDTSGIETPVKQLEDDESSHSDEAKAQLHSESVPTRELENSEIIPPVELPALEPVGSELNTPRDGSMAPIEEWPLPLSPLPLLFAMTELRDEKAGRSDSPKHETFYHP